MKNDPLKVLLKKKVAKKFTQKVYATMFKNEKEWILSEVFMTEEDAVKKMRADKKEVPSLKYKVVVGELYIAQHYIKAPGF